MNIRRFFAPDMRRAIRMVRDEHGADAVILSSRAVDGGMEIVSAVDYDQDLITQMVHAARPKSAGGESEAEPEPEAAGSVAAVPPSVRNDVAAALESKAAAPDAEPPAPARAAPAAVDAGSGAASGTAASPVGKSTPEPVRPSAVDKERHEPGSVRSSKDVHARRRAVPARRHAAARATTAASPAELNAISSELRAMKSMLREQFAHLNWADLKMFQPERAMLVNRVASLGLEVDVAEMLVANVERPEGERAWREVLLSLARRLTVPPADPLQAGGIFALVGPTGAGKTTTIAKLAARYCLRHGPDDLALISTDTMRVGAQRQLDAYGAILGVPVRRAADNEELAHLLRDLGNRGLILIDTAGMAPRDRDLEATLRRLDVDAPLQRFLVLAASTQAAVMHDAVDRFGAAGLAGVVLTKLDEASGLGPALSVLVRRRLQAVWLSDGQRVPEDLRLAQITDLLGWALEQAREEPQPWAARALGSASCWGPAARSDAKEGLSRAGA